MSQTILPVLIPHERVGEETLQRLLEDFATRDGTDYGATELSLTQRVQLIHQQLKRGEAKLVYFPQDESVQLVTEREAKMMGLED
ncbi:MAG TPA: YheU family protein [Marinagarivorans sp.]|nr:YheU family protein [Cellvibrionaceae bacterium]HMY38288.1 YheU family protein [Marinagarivorans sp.]HNG60020.1 YheU family protein [Cellvibrionaceae bacterium]